ncbi:methyltransferase, TIGR04325 family [Lentisphaera profundi]|uniref:Methyltransferase, TIGR04325 family n=1 Tax=Lentisphaera profundi TaxID=1658616 RepID=A0ABY7VP70_9BACT|nr:methyltransferase, TIGR04325 family [Lentisphaera profundi]WDE95958.1 methyltransferase, TIGR04325 family [Lentisphaera profundi]
MKALIKKVLPPFVTVALQRLMAAYSIKGHYSSWEDATRASGGYDSQNIFQKVREAMWQVRDGHRVAERDSVLLDEIPYSWPVLCTVLRAVEDNKLHVVDFGGALGCSYYYYRDWLESIDHRWTVIEQEKFVECGNAEFVTDRLKFSRAFADVHKVDIILMSSVLQYLENPWEILEQAMATRCRFICLDRTLFSPSTQERIAIQKVSSKIYPASYPLRLLTEASVHTFLEPYFDLIAQYDSPESTSGFNCKGFIYRRKD